MKWSWKIAKVGGIGIFVHWTFLILIAWLVGIHVVRGSDLATALQGIAFVLAIFGCVVLHELGHAFAGKWFHIRTQDITLLPIGGVARLERMPEQPWQEFVIAIAGPLVNVGIAFVLFIVEAAIVGLKGVGELNVVGGDVLAKLMYVNVALVVFNLLPAFPMDGGRILRALLASRMDYVRATQYAASIGQGMAVLFAFFGLFYNPFLIFIALFVYLGAQQEAYAAQVRSLLRGVPVRAAMITHFQTLSTDTPLRSASQALLAGDQRDFPVMDGDQLVGVLGRDELIAGLSQHGMDAPVRELMQAINQTVTESQMLEAAFEQMQQAKSRVLPVMREGRLVGLLNMENISEWMMIQARLPQAQPRSDFQNVLEVLPPKKT